MKHRLANYASIQLVQVVQLYGHHLIILVQHLLNQVDYVEVVPSQYIHSASISKTIAENKFDVKKTVENFFEFTFKAA